MVMGRCTISGISFFGIYFVLLTLKVVACHHIRLCQESVKCLEDEKIRLDRFGNSSLRRELDQLRVECNRKVMCAWEELGCEYGRYSGMILEYSCIKDLPRYDGKSFLKSGTLLSLNYPNEISDEFRARLLFPKNVTLKLTFHDVGFLEQMLYLTVYSFQGKNWTKYTRLVSVKSKKVFPNAKIFDISLHAKRVWITFTSEEVGKPPSTFRHCPDGDQTSSDCPPVDKTPSEPKPKSKTWIIYTIIIAVLTIIVFVMIIVFIQKKFYFIKKRPLFCTRKHSVQRPDILTHFPSDGNIITGDILAHEIEAAAAEAEIEVEENRNSGDGDSISHYETIAVPHYSDFPKRPRPSVPELPPLPGLVTYIEIVPT